MRTILKSTIAVLTSFILILGALIIVIPNNFLVVHAGKPAPPNDSIDGLQYIDGPWYVNDTQTYSNEEIVLTGNLVINNGGNLTLVNTILRMNVTISVNPLWIIVKNGGKLNIWDKDNNPATNDGCLITDSTFDTDDGSVLDYRYYFRVEDGGAVQINCSKVEECGEYDLDQDENTWGLFIDGNNTIIINTTFDNSGYAIILNSTFNTLIDSVTVTNVDRFIWGLDCNLTYVQNCNFINGIIFEGGKNLWVINNTGSATYDTYYFSGIDTCNVYNNYGIRTSPYTQYHALHCISVTNLHTNHNNMTASSRPVLISDCYGAIIENQTFHATPSYRGTNYAIQLSGCTNSIIKNSQLTASGTTISGIALDIRNSDGIHVNGINIENCYMQGLYTADLDGFTIENCTFRNCSTYQSYQGVFLFNSNSGVFKNNLIEFSYRYEMKIDGTNTYDLKIINNTFGGNPDTLYGILQQDGTNFLYLDNHFKDYGTNALFIQVGSNNNVINNSFIGGYDDYRGFKAQGDYNRFVNNTIDTGGLGIDVYGPTYFENVTVSGQMLDAINVYDTVIAKNCSFTGSFQNDIEIGSNAEMYLINGSYNPAKVTVGSNSNLYIQWLEDFYVQDLNGKVPGATVRVLNKTSDLEIISMTGSDGYAIMPVTEELITNDGSGEKTIDYNPHNISAIIWPDIAYVTPEPNILSNGAYYINFSIDTHPPIPFDVKATTVSGDVNLTWNYAPVLDLNGFEVYRSLDPTTFNFNSPVGILSASRKFWVDVGGSSDWKTYYYCIKAKDDISQFSNTSEVVMCGDWVVANGVSSLVADMDLLVNGSLIIESGGSLSLVDINLTINQTTELTRGILVQGGSILEIKDGDNNPGSTGDATNISALNPSLPITFIVEQLGKLYLNNSFCYGVGHKMGLRNTEGLFISGQGSIIRDNTFLSTSETNIGVILEDTSSIQFLNNIIENSIGNGLEVIDSTDCTIDRNTINSSSPSHGIYLNGADNNKIMNNTVSNCSYGIYLRYCQSNDINNNLVQFQDSYGIYLYHSDYIVLDHNNIRNNTKSWGIYLYQSDHCNITNSTFVDNFEGIYVDICTYSRLENNYITGVSQTGIEFMHAAWHTLVNNTVVDAPAEAILFSGSGASTRDITITGGTLSGSGYGIYFYFVHTIDIKHVTIIDNVVGLYLYSSGLITLDDCDIIDSVNYGTYIEFGTTNSYKVNLGMENCTLSNSIGQELGIDDSTVVVALNTSIPFLDIDFKDAGSMITFQWYVHVLVVDMFGSPASDASVYLNDNVNDPALIGTTGWDGYLRWLVIKEKTTLRSGNISFNPYTFSALFSNHSGSNITSVSGPTKVIVKMDNLAPSVTDLLISPLTPTTLEQLSVRFNYTDPENDIEFPSKIIWFANGVEVSALANLTVVPSSYTLKNENWYAEVSVFDGVAYSTPQSTQIIKIKNTAPIVSDVSLLPLTPSSTTDIQVNYTFTDVDNDTDIDSIIKWFKDTGTGFVDAQLTGITLSSDFTKKGESWKCSVKPFDADDYGLEVESPVITIGNSAPTVSNAKITPANPSSNETLGVSYDFIDPDLDSESGSLIKWYKNGAEQFSLTGSFSVPPDNTKKGESWYYNITPSDGEDYGDYLESTPVTIGNTAPTVVNITILPKNPTTADNLTVQYEFVDQDGDLESFETNVQWLRKRTGDIAFAYTGLRVKTLSSIYTTKNEIWTCEVTPHDNLAYGETVRAEVSVTILNSAPSASNVIITPNNPTTTSVLSANYNYHDLDNDLEVGTAISWYRDGMVVSELNNEFSVAKDFTSKGEEWYYIIQPKDGHDLGDPVKSESIIIQNSAPIASKLSIAPSEPLSGDDLIASYNYSDEDDDTESTTEIRWFRNGLQVVNYDDKMIVDSDATKKSEIWYFTIRVNDGTDYSEVFTSHYVVIGNSEAIITALYPGLGKVVINETESIEFYIQAVDPDGDPLSYRWKLDKNTVSDDEYYLFETDYDSKRAYNLTVTVQDVAAGSTFITFAWEIIVNNKNRLPTVTVIEPITRNAKVVEDKSLKFSVSATDPDKEDRDRLIIKWYFDEVYTGQTGSSYAYLAKEADLGRHEVKVEVTDGMDSVDYSWNTTVLKKESGVEEIAGLSVDMWGLLLAVISGILAIIMFLFGFVKMRKKKSRLKEYMEEIDLIMESKKSQRDKEDDLIDLKGKIKKEFSAGLIIENHYLILEREVDNAIGEIRTEVVTRGVVMPKELKGDVEDVLEDGIVTSEEYRNIIERVKASRDLSPIDKNKLDSLMTRWMLDGKKEKDSRVVKSRSTKIKSRGLDLTEEDQEDIIGLSEENDELDIDNDSN